MRGPSRELRAGLRKRAIQAAIELIEGLDFRDGTLTLKAEGVQVCSPDHERSLWRESWKEGERDGAVMQEELGKLIGQLRRRIR